MSSDATKIMSGIKNKKILRHIPAGVKNNSNKGNV